MLGLSFVFKEIDTGGGEVEDNDGDGAKEDDFFARDDKGAAHALHGGAIFSEFKDADEAKESECPRGAQIETDDDVEGEHGEEVDDAEEGKGVAVTGAGECEAGEVLDGKDEDACDFEGAQGSACRLAEVGQGLDRKGDQVEYNQ